MFLGKFIGVLDNNKNKVYYVIKCEDLEHAFVTANKYFKTKRNKLNCKKVFMKDENANEFTFNRDKINNYDAWAVYVV